MPHASVPPLSARSGGPDVSVRLLQLVRNSEGTISVSLDATVLQPEHAPPKFVDPDWTATRERRATVALARLETLWINTGTLCNITCQNCYIESSPSNDRLAYITAAEAAAYFDEIEAQGLGTREIGFTGGEPFMNPDLLAMVGDALRRGFEVLVLSNAMQPMQRPKIKRGILELAGRYGAQLTIRVSLDHYTRALHEAERGARTWERTLAGLDWLSTNGVRVAIAGRTCWNESEADTRAGYARLICRARLAHRCGRPRRARAAAGDGRQARCARDHHALLGHPQEEPRRHDVRLEPHGREAPRRGTAIGPALHAHPLRPGL